MHSTSCEIIKFIPLATACSVLLIELCGDWSALYGVGNLDRSLLFLPHLAVLAWIGVSRTTAHRYAGCVILLISAAMLWHLTYNTGEPPDPTNPPPLFLLFSLAANIVSVSALILVYFQLLEPSWLYLSKKCKKIDC
jgi:hypothetical protein